MRICAEWPVPEAVRFNTWVYGRSLARIPGSNPAGAYRYLSLVIVVYCQVKADPSREGFLASVLCLSVVVELR